MYGKVLVPMDKSSDAEKVLPLIKSQVDVGGEVVPLHIIPFSHAEMVGQHVIPGSQLEGAERAKAMDYLQRIAKEMSASPFRCRAEVVAYNSVVDGIVGCAKREGADLIAMYIHNRKGIFRLIKGSIAKNVAKRALSEVQIFSPQELVGASIS